MDHKDFNIKNEGNDYYSYNFLNLIRLGLEQNLSRPLSRFSMTKAKLNRTEKSMKAPKGFFLEKEKSKTAISLEGKSARFTSYAPKLFMYLRSFMGIESQKILTSLCGNPLLSMSGESGKSGMSFYVSSDFKFVIKTLTLGEKDFLLSILKSYTSYLKSNKHSLLSIFYGLFKVTFIGQTDGNANETWAPLAERKIFVIMNNVFLKDLFNPDLETFDLKGTTEDRFVSVSNSESTKTQKAKENMAKKKKVQKDINFEMEKREIRVSESMRVLLTEQIRRDVIDFLRKHKIMDYSLLLGIKTIKIDKSNSSENITENRKEEKKESEVRIEDINVLNNDLLKDRLGKLTKSVFMQNDGGILGEVYHREREGEKEETKELYYVGVIDILQSYNLYKKAAHQYKKQIKYAFTNIELDTVAPKKYAQRFIKYTLSIVTCNDGERLDKDYMTKTLKKNHLNK